MDLSRDDSVGIVRRIAAEEAAGVDGRAGGIVGEAEDSLSKDCLEKERLMLPDELDEGKGALRGG